MSKLDDLILKMPRALLVFIVLAISLAVIISQNPMSDGCEVEITNFGRDVRGLMRGFRTSKKLIQYPQMDFMRDQCIKGNSQGSCEDYFKAIKRVADAARVVSPKCYPKLKENFDTLTETMATGLKVMALVAWGSQPPAGISQRISWLTESDIYGFCRTKNMLIALTDLESYTNLRASVYREFPDHWPEKLDLSERSELTKPRAWQTANNPAGSLKENEVYERSLFSLRCDLYQ